MTRRRLTAGLAAAAVALASCTTAGTTAETDPTTAATTTTAQPAPVATTSSTLAPPPPPPTTTTTSPAPPQLTIDLGDAPRALAEAVAGLYLFAADPQPGPAAGLPLGLRAHLTGAVEPLPKLDLVGEAAVASLPAEEGGGPAIAVVTLGDDVVTAVDEGDGWRVVGAHLARFGVLPWFGPEHRMVLVIGSDARPGQSQLRFRADSLHIMTAVPAQGTGALVGIPRDTWVDHPLGGQDKIAHLMASNGPEVELEGVRNFTDLPIEGYVVTGFRGFTSIVDALGGLVVTVPFRIVTNGFEGQPSIPAGTQRLSGIRTLLFARIRKTVPGGDFTRSAHQGIITLAALAEAQSRGLLAVPGLLNLLLSYAWTDLPAEDLLNVAVAALYMDVGSVSNVVLPGHTDRAPTGASIVVLDPEAWDIIEDVRDGILDSTQP